MVPEPALVERFSADLDALIAPEEKVGAAVSGGPDSLALLLLASAARPGRIEAATIDHALRSEAKTEAAMVAQVCAQLGVPHVVLTARWDEIPKTAIQERARSQRYRLLGYWAEERGLGALATAHHADDQAETVLMRLARGSGVRGLAGMRAHSIAPGSHERLIRPLLGWRRSELEQVCEAAALTPVADPSNNDDRFERIRVRRGLASIDWLNAAAISRSAANLADADMALEWAASIEWRQSVKEHQGAISFRPGDVPIEIVRRIVARVIRKLATEGESELRGKELDRLLEELADGGTATIRGVLCAGARDWRFTQAPPRDD